MDDDGLIARLAAGDGTAVRELFARHAPWLATRLRAALPASDVEDVLQETFLAAWQRGASVPARGQGRGVDVGHRPAPGGACGCGGEASAALLVSAYNGTRRLARHRRRHGRSLSRRAELDGAVADAGAGCPEARGMDAVVRGGPLRGPGGRPDGRPDGHGQEPRPPGPAAAADGARGRLVMEGGPL